MIGRTDAARIDRGEDGNNEDEPETGEEDGY